MSARPMIGPFTGWVLIACLVYFILLGMHEAGAL